MAFRIDNLNFEELPVRICRCIRQAITIMEYTQFQTGHIGQDTYSPSLQTQPLRFHCRMHLLRVEIYGNRIIRIKTDTQEFAWQIYNDPQSNYNTQHAWHERNQETGYFEVIPSV